MTIQEFNIIFAEFSRNMLCSSQIPNVSILMLGSDNANSVDGTSKKIMMTLKEGLKVIDSLEQLGIECGLRLNMLIKIIGGHRTIMQELYGQIIGFKNNCMHDPSLNSDKQLKKSFRRFFQYMKVLFKQFDDIENALKDIKLSCMSVNKI